MRVLIILQHWNARKQLQGFANSHLTEIGEAQARQAGEYIARRFSNVQAVYSSDLKRASDTAQAIAEKLQLPVQHDTRLRETNLGVFQGNTWAGVAEHFEVSLAAFTSDSRTCVPGGESHASKYCRVVHALHCILHEHMHTPGPVVIVCHGGIAREVHRAATRDPLLYSGKAAVHVPNACISLLGYAWADKAACSSSCSHAHLPQAALRYEDVVPCGLQLCKDTYMAAQHTQQDAHTLTLHGREVLLPDDSIRAVPVPLTAEQWAGTAAPGTPGSVEVALPAKVPLAKCGQLSIEQWGITEHLQHVT